MSRFQGPSARPKAPQNRRATFADSNADFGAVFDAAAISAGVSAAPATPAASAAAVAAADGSDAARVHAGLLGAPGGSGAAGAGGLGVRGNYAAAAAAGVAAAAASAQQMIATRPMEALRADPVGFFAGIGAPNIIPVIQNIVCTVNLATRLDLQKISSYVRLLQHHSKQSSFLYVHVLFVFVRNNFVGFLFI